MVTGDFRGWSNQGWQCPGCGYCYSPSFQSCSNCNRPEHQKTETRTGTNEDTFEPQFKDGGIVQPIPGHPTLAVDTDYMAKLKTQLDEAIKKMEADGLGTVFHTKPVCYCIICQEQMP